MEKQFSDIFARANTDDVKVLVNKVGDRPCGDTDPEKIATLVELLRPVISDVIGMPVNTKAASTDCNIPLSLGIPAVCIGVYFGEGAHTRQEWVRKDSLVPGLEVAIRVAHTLMENTL